MGARKLRCRCRACAPPSEIKRAYRKLAFSLHPDVGDNPDETRFREAREAYQALIQMEQAARAAQNRGRALSHL
jgi:DnaJ-class molecular chaperone